MEGRESRVADEPVARQPSGRLRALSRTGARLTVGIGANVLNAAAALGIVLVMVDKEVRDAVAQCVSTPDACEWTMGSHTRR